MVVEALPVSVLVDLLQAGSEIVSLVPYVDAPAEVPQKWHHLGACFVRQAYLMIPSS